MKHIKIFLVLSFFYISWYETRPIKDFDKIKYEKYKNLVPKSKVPKEVLIYFKITEDKIKVFEGGYKNLELNYGEKKVITKYKKWLELELKSKLKTEKK